MTEKRLSVASIVATAALALFLGGVVGRLTGLGQRAPVAGPPAGTESKLSSKRYKIPVTSSQPTAGALDALVTIVEWCNLPDVGCRAIEPALQALTAKNSADVRLVFRHYARPSEPSSGIAHEFLRGAHEQAGKFWPARALLLAHDRALTLADLERYAIQLRLDWPRLHAAMDKHTYVSAITADHLFADMFDVHETPAIFVNGRPLDRPLSAQRLNRLVDEERKRATELVAHGFNKADVYTELTKNGEWTPLARAAR
jgi:NhaA family Na+:H+ antiporter